MGASSALRTMLMPACTSSLGSESLPTEAFARSSATPPVNAGAKMHRLAGAKIHQRVSTPEQKCISDADKEALEHGRFPEASGLGWIVRRVGGGAAGAALGLI